MAKRIVVLGSTGSIGRQTLSVASALGEQVEVVGLAAGNNWQLLWQQAQQFRPAFLACPKLAGDEIRCLGSSAVSLEEMAALPEADLVVVGTVGMVGLAPAMAAIKAGKTVALANKEVLVTAGRQITELARAHNATILPIDSEHNAIWQCLRGEDPATVQRLILTASGGAFRDLDRSELAHVTPEQALRHPTWEMGRKVTVDSATLLNKGLEVIEAHWLFDVPYEKIDVILHKESIVHSMVEFVDGSIKAQLGAPDMRLPIQYALSYPTRKPNAWQKLDLSALGQLSFGNVDLERFACLRLARDAGVAGGTCPAVLNAAGEVAAEAFLAGQINFLDIALVIERALEHHDNNHCPDIAEILSADRWAREFSRQSLARTL